MGRGSAAGAGDALGPDGGVVVTRLRHLAALERAEGALQECLDIIEEGRPIDLVSIALRDAIEALGEITGETAGDEVIERIFREFCVGK